MVPQGGRLMRYLEHLIRAYPRSTIRAFVVAGCLAAVAAAGVRIDNSVERLMIADDPLRMLDEAAKAEFGNDEVLMVALELGAPYTAADLAKLAAISSRVAKVPGVKRVRDLSSTEDVRAQGDGLDASRLVDLETLEADFETIRTRTAAHRLYHRLLISEDQDIFGMLVTAESSHSNSKQLSEFTRAVVAAVEESAPPWPAYFAGYPITAYEANRIVKRDLGILTPPALLVIGAILFAFTRRWFPLGLMAALMVWTELIAFAWLGLTDTPLNVVVSSIPTILLATSSTYVIYTLGILGQMADEPDPGVALLRSLARPVLLSSISTAFGFLSLRFIDVQAIGDFGVTLAIGIAAAGFGTLLLLPAMVQRYRWRLVEHHIGILDGVSQWGVRLAANPLRVVAVAALVLAVAVPGVMRLRVHTDTLSYFADDNVVRKGADFFSEHLSSGFLLNIVIRAGEEGGALDPAVVGVADAIARDLGGSPFVDRTISMLDYFYLMDAALRPTTTPVTVPETREAAAQYMLLYESSGDPDDYSRYVNFDRSAIAMLASVHGGSDVYLDLAERIAAIARGAPDGVRVKTLGSTFLYSKAMDGLTRGMVVGVTVAATLIGVMMLIGLRSIRLALVAAIPNLVPIAVCGGVIGWLGMPLSMGTSLVGCIVLGLAVDDTAHVLGHLDPRVSLRRLYGLVGPAILMTTIALAAGFLMLTLSEFQSVTALGAATAATMIIALLGDLLLLPSLLALIGYPVTDQDIAAKLQAADSGRSEEVGDSAAA